MAYQGNGYGPQQQTLYGYAQNISRRPVPGQQLQTYHVPPQVNGPISSPPYPPRPGPQPSIPAQERQNLLNAGVPTEELPPESKDGIHSSITPTNEHIDAGAVHSWPTEPARLGRKGIFSTWISPTFDILLAILPILFVVLGVLARLLDQKLVSGHAWGLTLITATRYGVTIYPILFAAIIGSVMQSTAAWLAERGATIMVLEQLTGSAALFATLKTQFQLGAWNYRGFLLVLLWALSPLGGQGNLRLISVESRGIVADAPVWFLNTSMSGGGIGSLFTQDTSTQIDPVNSIYLASLIAPNETQEGSQDTWGNIKIPRIESLTTGSPQSNEWYPVPSSDVSYSSLVGIPVAAVPKKGNSTFIMSSSYCSLSCPKGPQLIPSENEVVWSDADHANSTKTGGVGGYIMGSRDPVVGTGSSRYYKDGSRITTFSIGSFGPFFEYGKRPSEPTSIYFQSETDNTSNDNDAITALNCTVIATNVDSRVSCRGQVCNVTSMRLTPGLPYPDPTTSFSSMDAAWGFFSYFEVASGYYNSVGHYTTNSLIEQYLYYGSSPLAFSDRMLPRNLSLISGSDLAERLARLLNSFWIPSLDPVDLVGNLPSASDMLTGNASMKGDFIGLQTRAQVTTLEEIFVCHNAWLGVLFISALVLLICALVGLVLKFLTKGPEIFGHVSSFTRDNPYVCVPAGGSALDGFERARLLRDVKIRVGDVAVGNNGVGHVAIMSVDGRGYVDEKARLDHGRFYD